MSGQGINLRPYGDEWGNTGAGAPVEGSMEEQAIARARNKLQSVRSGRGGDQPAGADIMLVLPWAIVSLILGGPFFLIAMAVLFEGKEPGLAVFFLILSTPILSIPFIMFFKNRPRTPKGALVCFYRALARGKPKRAKKLAVNADFDSFPRYQPAIPDLGRPTGYPRPFADPQGFDSYWRQLLLGQDFAYCLATVRKVNITNIGHDVVLVDFELRLMMNTRLWILLFLVIGIFAIIIDLATRKTVTVPMRKVLVKVGEEYKLLSAEWQGYEEFDVNWLRSRT